MKHRRLVNLHTTGRYADIAHIHGVESTPSPLTDSELPTHVECQLLDGRVRWVELVGTTERAVFYREVA
jgi:hypothetical protein